VPSNLINVIKGLHVGAQARVREAGQFSEAFPLQMGLKQGSVFSPLFFNIFFGAIIVAIHHRLVEERVHFVRVQSKLSSDPFNSKLFKWDSSSVYLSLCEFFFADDAAFVALSNDVLQKILNIADEVLSAFGQSISVTKTEIMVIQPRSEEKPELLPIFVRGQQLQNSLSFKYIGGKISVSASLTAEIDTRLNMMAAAYVKNRINLLENREIPLKLRLRGFIAFVLSSALYGSETWNVLKADVARLDSFQYRSLRRLLRFRATEHISYASIIHTCRSTGVDIMPISIMISKRRLSYFGHVCRMDSYRLPKIMLHSQLLGDTGSLSRGRGAPEMSYKSALLEDMRNFGIMDRKSKDNCCINTLKWEMLLDITKDRARWRKVVKTDGVCKALNQWYIAENTKSNKRHIKSDGENFI